MKNYKINSILLLVSVLFIILIISLFLSKTQMEGFRVISDVLDAKNTNFLISYQNVENLQALLDNTDFSDEQKITQIQDYITGNHLNLTDKESSNASEIKNKYINNESVKNYIMAIISYENTDTNPSINLNKKNKIKRIKELLNNKF